MSDPTGRANRLTHLVRPQDYPNSRPRDAATLIVLDERDREPRVLMGRRHDRHIFLPGKFVFPGGSVDNADLRLAAPDDLKPETEAKLLVDMKGSPSRKRARALALSALRETFEETGLMIGDTSDKPPASQSSAWREFFHHGVYPSLKNLRFIARAITPPRRPRRYDTRFFCVSHKEIAKTVTMEERELLDLHWFTLSEAGGLDLPIITQVILEELAGHLEKGGLPGADAPVPYYFMAHGRFRREFI